MIKDDNRTGHGPVSLSYTHPQKKKKSSLFSNPMSIKFLSHPHHHRKTAICPYSYPYSLSYCFNIN